MAGPIPHAVRPGGLSPEDHAQILKYAGRGWKATRIAYRIEKHPATVQWFMYRNGLATPRYRNQPGYWRGGRFVKPFVPAEDAFIEALRVEGQSSRRIADLVTKAFGHPRSFHTVECRLVMLAAREVA